MADSPDDNCAKLIFTPTHEEVEMADDGSTIHPKTAASEINSGDIDPGDGRDETANERSDRNWVEILQELRVTQTGTQIISGFLLTLAFQQRFSDLHRYQLILYVILVLLATATTAIGLAPVSLHRILFQRHEKERMVRIGNTFLLVDLALVSLLTAGVALFIVDVVVGLSAGLAAGIGTFVVLLILLVLIPIAAKKRRDR